MPTLSKGKTVGHVSAASGRSCNADRLPRKSKAKANAETPKGRETSAAALLPDSSAALAVAPTGQTLIAAELPHSAEATSSTPQGQILVASALTPVIDEIRGWHRQRVFAMEMRKRVDLALGAFVRMSLGWSRDLPEKDRAILAAKAKRILDGKESSAVSPVVAATASSRAPFEDIEAGALKEMERLAVLLPVWESFGKPIRGLGPASLAVIVAEAGDLDKYSTHSKLWKRMGLAVMDGIRQGGLPKSAKAEEWIRHGYSRMRRSKMWNIGDALIKGNREGEYRQTYLARKAYEIERNPEIKPIVAHRRAQRYMEKRLLRNLWRSWRAAKIGVKTSSRLPLADPIGQRAQSGLPSALTAMPSAQPIWSTPELTEVTA